MQELDNSSTEVKGLLIKIAAALKSHLNLPLPETASAKKDEIDLALPQKTIVGYLDLINKHRAELAMPATRAGLTLGK